MSGNKKFWGKTVKQSLTETIIENMRNYKCDADFAMVIRLDSTYPEGTQGAAEAAYFDGMNYDQQAAFLANATRASKRKN